MSMFNGLAEEIKILNSDAKNVTNCEKAKKLRKKLLSIGLPMAIIGIAGAFACFVLFGLAGFSSIGKDGGPNMVNLLVPFFLIVPCAAVGGIGGQLVKLGLGIVIAGYATNLVDETVGNNCPKCGDRIDKEEMFCSKCGYEVKKECPNCKTINTYKDKFCKKCGKEL